MRGWFTKKDGTHVNIDNNYGGISSSQFHEKSSDIVCESIHEKGSDVVEEFIHAKESDEIQKGRFKPDINKNGQFLESDHMFNLDDIETGEIVVEKMDLILNEKYPGEELSVKTRLDGEMERVRDGVLETLGASADKLDEFLDYRLNGIKDGKHWIMALPLPFEDKNGNLLLEDHGGFQTDAYKHKVRFAVVNPAKFLEDWAGDITFGSVGSREAIEKYKQMLRDGKPIGTPFIQINAKTGRVYNHEGRHRAQAAFELGIDKMPVEIISNIPVEEMTKEQKNMFLNEEYLKQSA